ncbi:right-handed parallel beta-helix repeat-containing protein [Tabrizicola sp. BL-A-41-H6]|uniref:right-handed parallel beta-helix repeat-containing protein n=1 Tax=Tabrizicola sp. BL-A-41-H6 TaxID=3421107 RepID=UPI003D667D38
MFAARTDTYTLGAICKNWLAVVCIAATIGAVFVPGLAEADTGRTFHVSPTNGNDKNPGTRDKPLGSIAAAVGMVEPGDTILLSAGVYKIKSRNSYGVRITRDGTKSAPITMRAEGGEALIDCSALTKTRTVYCLQLEADWWRISNVAVTGSKQNRKGAWAVGINVLNASNNILQSVRAFKNAGPGIAVMGKSGNNLLQDCESFSNYDPLAVIPGGNADGVQIATIHKNMVGNVVSRCNAHNNSDDGFDLWKTEAPVTIEYSTARRNGFIPGTSDKAGDGVGFKLGKNTSGPKHRILYNRALNNRAAGFDRNGAARAPIYVENVAQGNGGGAYK